jgi:type IV fimbrial biogenesis protein FimT
VSLPARTLVPRQPECGLTLVELLVVLVVLGVLIALVAPSMRGMIARQRVQGVNTELVTDLQLARSEMAKRSGTSTKVAVSFGATADFTCYSVHTVATGGTCDCARLPAAVCTAPAQEIKSMQFARAGGVSVAASSPSGSTVEFAPPQGLATPGDLLIDVRDATSGHLRTSINAMGRPSVCSPDGSIKGVTSPC